MLKVTVACAQEQSKARQTSVANAFTERPSLPSAIREYGAPTGFFKAKAHAYPSLPRKPANGNFQKLILGSMGNNAKASSWKDFVVSVKAKWFAVAAIVVVSALCLWQGARRYTRYKEQRLAVQARLFLQHGRYKEAFLTTQQILGANPANVDGCRFMAELTERAKDPSTLIWRRRVAELSPALENRLAL